MTHKTKSRLQQPEDRYWLAAVVASEIERTLEALSLSNGPVDDAAVHTLDKLMKALIKALPSEAA